MRRLLAFLSALLVVVAAQAAHANGRFPASNGVIFAPTADEAVLVRVTFGLLVSRDHAQSWRWICERAIGFSGLEDPSYIVTKSGAIVVGLYDGISVSRDGGCSWERVPTDARVFVDLTERGDGAIVALSSSYDRHTDAGSSFTSQLYLSTDDARTFVPLGTRLDPTLLAESVELAPSNPNRIYVSAVRGADAATRKGVMLVSDDAGKQWKERALELAPKELGPFIAAVDPTRADRVYVRTSASPESPTRLLVTDDAAKTYRTLLDAKGPLLGFALAERGASLHVGGPDDGLFSGRVDAPLTKAAPLKVQCLALQGDVLWACSNEANGFVAGTKTAGGPFVARLHLRDIAGPLTCPPGSSVAKECETDWRKLRSDLGLDDAPVDGGADGGADAGPGGAHLLEGAPEPDALKKSRTARVLVILAVLGAAAMLVRSRRGKR